MSSNPPDANQVYYDRHAAEFAERTLGLDMEALYEPFLSRLPSGARILDAGCGPGRDLKIFSERGYAVVGMDSSEAMVQLARTHSKQEVHHLRFQQVTWENAFDGIWASASLLHVPDAEMPGVFVRLGRALKVGGTLSASFKYGHTERVAQGRRFTDYNEAKLTQLLAYIPQLCLASCWYTSDVRADRAADSWLNALLIKRTPDATSNH